MENRARRLVVGLVLAHLVLHGLVFWFIGRSPSPAWPRLPQYFLFMLNPAQATLVGLWVALPGRGTARRILAVLVAVSIWRCVGNVHGEWWCVFLSQLGIVTGVLLIAHQMGLELTSEPGSGDGHPQFSILHSLGWITGAAVVLAVLRSLPEDSWTAPFASELLLLTLGSFTPVALASIWAALGRRWTIVRALVLLGAIIAGTIPPMNWGLSLWECFIVPISESVWLVGSLLVIRRAGYHLAWRARRKAGVESDKALDSVADSAIVRGPSQG